MGYYISTSFSPNMTFSKVYVKRKPRIKWRRKCVYVLSEKERSLSEPQIELRLRV